MRRKKGKKWKLVRITYLIAKLKLKIAVLHTLSLKRGNKTEIDLQIEQMQIEKGQFCSIAQISPVSIKGGACPVCFGGFSEPVSAFFAFPFFLVPLFGLDCVSTLALNACLYEHHHPAFTPRFTFLFS